MDEALAKLIENKDFGLFIGKVLTEFCAFDQGYGLVDEFHQGVRAAGSYIIRELSRIEGGADMLAALYRKHFGELTKQETVKQEEVNVRG